uniref:LisH domain-containing protein n=1 Tax=Heliothis virescens TaxID=7102 RepID=A0A2A4IXS1_HELVI
MESGVTKEFPPAVAESINVANTESADSFQSFIYELFEKNGILNDLRAYLRGHIVNVLKSAQTGDPPPCQKHFTQRLELTYQALNILIAEYLLRLEFTYSFSVFISEIPLANMVFGFAKSLMERTQENKAEMRFKDTDVWSILNYLGVQCDSEHASNIFEMYKNDKQQPLLLCILKCMPMYKEYVPNTTAVASDESLSSAKTITSVDNKASLSNDVCKHYLYCKNCQSRLYRLKELSKKKKKNFVKNLKDAAMINPANMEGLVKNIGVMEKSLIEEMFQQLKSVYETEVEMVKAEEENKVKRSMATHALQLQKKRDEMEETFKAREAELERTVQQKKRFLWGLARALRDQHEHMTRAMHDVRAETQRLSVKEDSLKSQLAEAEQILKKRGEEMRAQISNELTILEGHLESMKKERENITKERLELENMKTVHESSSKLIKVHNMESENVHSHYNLLKDELAILRKYLESSRLTPKCVIERGTVTEQCSASTSRLKETLNNSQLNDKCSKSEDFDDRLKTNQVVNDFRKKNVNFSQSNLDELYRERSRERSRSSASSEAGDTAAPDLDLDRGCERDLIHRLREENDRLKAIATEQSRQIEQLSVGGTTRVARPRTAPPATAAAQPAYK